MLLDEDPAALIAQCTSHFKIANDKTSLHRINESLSTLSEFRTQHLQKFKIAKQASDLEIEGERLQSDLARLGGVAGELEEEGVEGGVEPRAGEDATVLKLKLYRTLGIDVEADPTTGEYNKAVIRNATKGDVHVVNIDPKFSRHFYTNYFWRTM
ncbi:unnamed protein product [Alternaria alternata]